MKNMQQLDTNEVVDSECFVLVGKTEDSGFRKFDGPIWGCSAGTYEYPIYRKVSEDDEDYCEEM